MNSPFHPVAPGGARQRLAALVAILGIAGLAACQPETQAPPALSLEQARDRTAAVETHSFVPPPRRIDDITETLRKTRQEFVRGVRHWRRRAAAEPAAGLSPREKGRFYKNRAIMKGRLGDVPGLLADMERAAETDPAFLLAMAQWQLRHGLYSRGFATLEKLAAAGTDNPLRAFQQVRVRFSLIVEYANQRELEKAETLLSESMDVLTARFDRCRRGAERGNRRAVACLGLEPFFTMLAQYVRARILDTRGELAGAEALYRSSFEAGNRNGTWPPPMQHGRRGRRDYAHLPAAAAPFLQSCALALADNLRRQGRLSEAEVWARKSLRLVPSGTLFAADVLQSLTRIIYDQGRFADARRLAEAGIGIYDAASIPPHSVSVARSYIQRADALAAQEKWADALAQYEAVRRRMSADSRAFRTLLAVNLNWGIALARTGRPDDALAMFDTILARRRAALGDDHYETAEVRGFIGMAKAEKGDLSGAIAAFRAAMPALVAAASGESRESLRPGAAQARRLRLILEAYLRVMTTVYEGRPDPAQREAVAEMFRIAGILRTHSVQRALSSAAARSAIRDPDLAALARREQDAAWKLESIGRLAADLAGRESRFGAETARIAALRGQMRALREARAVILAEIERRFPDYAAIANPRPPTLSDTRAALATGEALIATYVGHDGTHVWAVPKDGAAAFAVVPLGRTRVAAAVTGLRRALDPNAARLSDIPPFDIGLSHRLYRTLLAPVRGGWEKANSLLVIAHAELGQLPFSVLVTEPATPAPDALPPFARYRQVAWLARRYAVTVLPSVGSLTTLRRLPPADRTRRAFAGFGDPVFDPAASRIAAAVQIPAAGAPVARGQIATRSLPVHLRAVRGTDGAAAPPTLASLPRLPDTAAEIRSIALAMQADLTRDVFTGRAASEDRVKHMALAQYRVIAFATHGLVPGDLDGLTQPALALSSPTVTGASEDGLLTMGEIMGLRLDADWVVLSACNTASGNGAGAEAVSGLGQAFFYAGTRALLVSNWPVETTSARLLTTDLFRRQAADPALTRAEALRRAMLALIDGPGFRDARGRTVFSYAHPIFWAPFSLVGDGGGGKPAG